MIINKIKKINWKFLILTILVLITIIISIVLITGSNIGNLKGEIDCSFNNIEYTNITPYNCWYNDISSNYCPMPKDIHCKINGNIPINVQFLTTLLSYIQSL